MKTEWRISLGITLVMAVALALALSLIHVFLNRFQEHHFDRALVEIARQEAREAPVNRFSFISRPGPAPNHLGPFEKYGVYYDTDGNVDAATQPFDVAPPPLSEVTRNRGVPFDLEYKGNTLRAVLVEAPGAERHTLLLAVSRDELDGDDQFMKRAMTLAFVASLLCLFVVALALTGRFTREHRRLAMTLHRVAHGDVLARVPAGARDPVLIQWGQDLNGVAQQLSALIRSQQQFIAYAAHELRSPITALYGELQQALRKERSAEGYKESIETALQATRRLRSLADDLLTLARAEHDPERFEPVNLSNVFEALTRELRAAASDKQLNIEADFGSLSVHGRAADIQRLLRNLFDNAIRHSPPGKTIRCDAVLGEGVVRISVRDQGPGVPAEDQQRIFEPFFRSSQTRGTAREGSGLGLSIAREIARAHGGELRIDGTSPGAVFVIELPVAPEASLRRAAE